MNSGINFLLLTTTNPGIMTPMMQAEIVMTAQKMVRANKARVTLNLGDLTGTMSTTGVLFTIGNITGNQFDVRLASSKLHLEMGFLFGTEYPISRQELLRIFNDS